jgi:hypothetical protein
MIAGAGSIRTGLCRMTYEKLGDAQAKVLWTNSPSQGHGAAGRDADSLCYSPAAVGPKRATGKSGSSPSAIWP